MRRALVPGFIASLLYLRARTRLAGMGPHVTTVCVVALLSAACGAQDALPGGAETATSPRLTIVSTSPLTARGRGFRPNERVKLIATGRGVESKTVKATPRGSFTVRFRLSPAADAAVAVQAIGSQGSRAMVDITQPDRTPP